MKRFFYSTIAIVMISSAFVACQKEQPSAEPEKSVVEAKPFTVTVNHPFSADDPQTKATFEDGKGLSWEEGDDTLFRMVVGTAADKGEVCYPKSMKIENGTATFTFDKTPAEGTTVSFFYGQKFGEIDNGNPASFCFEEEQNQDVAGKLNKENLILKAVAIKDKEAVRMSIVGNILCFRIYSSKADYQSEKVKSIKVGPQWTIGGQISYNYLGKSVGKTNSDNNPVLDDIVDNETVIRYNKHYVKLTAPEGFAVAKTKDDVKGLYLSIAPVVSVDTYYYSYEIETDKAVYTVKGSNSKGYKNNTVTTISINLANDSVNREVK